MTSITKQLFFHQFDFHKSNSVDNALQIWSQAPEQNQTFHLFVRIK